MNEPSSKVRKDLPEKVMFKLRSEGKGSRQGNDMSKGPVLKKRSDQRECSVWSTKSEGGVVPCEFREVPDSKEPIWLQVAEAQLPGLKYEREIVG